MAKIAQELLEETLDLLGRYGEPAQSFLGDLDPMEERALEPVVLPCLRHLDACAALAEGGAGEAIARLLAERGQRLRWGQTYGRADFDARFLDNYGWMELFGERGHYASDRLACGVLLLGPQTHYPDHHHEAEEIYIPLTPGALWSKGGAAFEARAAGDLIHHPSMMPHAMRTVADPLLALYLWRGGPLSAKSTVTGRADG